ncbi:BadM/Rrf2 family transcriptional regulator [Prosthecobacter fusiformis]|uniref:BadM/Rrf2 family transcriptional regulator n=1 Tax=Prosthecobacter fusiformis TaxID=48464 RepID=A0A4R7RRA9_9BACT|nr:Rrf2 family transcriptional regulator [Prosthecobacter fusiformis]TDU67276.1 BadM/Rrf2 family transcriptional regulator [Prosthecobacter fusiformis]
MKLSRKAEYAMRALLAMARSPETSTFSIQDIATRERIPLKFLEQILLVLKNGGMLRSKRGVGGGYQFQKAPLRISLGEIVQLIDGPFEPLPCTALTDRPGGTCECGIPGGCGLGQVFGGLRDDVNAWLTRTTLADVLEREKARQLMSFEI